MEPDPEPKPDPEPAPAPAPALQVSKSLRKVCDHCRRRRIRCDGEQPCKQCVTASLLCKRDHVPKRRGPKRGSGRVISELRAQDEGRGRVRGSRSRSDDSEGSRSTAPTSIDDHCMSDGERSSRPATPKPRVASSWNSIPDLLCMSPEEGQHLYPPVQFRPTTRSYFHLIPLCLDLFMEHIYPIMPLIHMPNLKASITRPLEPHEKNIVYSLCAVTSLHMSGKSIPANNAAGPNCWEAAGRFFLDECITNRQSYDFVEDRSLFAIISSYFVSTAWFELNQSRKSWYYLREALTLAQDMGLQDEKNYAGLSPSEELCRRRTFWILYVTERSFAIFRHKPLTLSKTPLPPTTLQPYESPEIHQGLIRLIHSYHLLDSAFVDSWNETSSVPTTAVTYNALQQQLNLPHPSSLPLTNIQKADILITQQWLRLIVWQSSMRLGLLSSTSDNTAMTFSYPLQIAHSLLSIISSLPPTSIEVHGMGIFEKIFEVGNTMLDVMQACGPCLPQTFAESPVQAPFEIFIKTLSQNENSQRQFANALLMKASEKPEVFRFGGGISRRLMPADTREPWHGSILGEFTGEDSLMPESEECSIIIKTERPASDILDDAQNCNSPHRLGTIWDPGTVLSSPELKGAPIFTSGW